MIRYVKGTRAALPALIKHINFIYDYNWSSETLKNEPDLIEKIKKYGSIIYGSEAINFAIECLLKH